jgi:hypothetical protein
MVDATARVVALDPVGVFEQLLPRLGIPAQNDVCSRFIH